jgi:hypothetical protein
MKLRNANKVTQWTVDKDAWDGCDERTNYIIAGGKRIASVRVAFSADKIIESHNASARTDVPALVKVVQHLRECIKAECSGVVAQACDMEAATIIREGK